MHKIDFTTPVRREMARVASVISLSEAVEFNESHSWLELLTFRSAKTLLTFDCEIARDCGTDVRFRPLSSEAVGSSVHTFLRLFDLPVAYQLGRCLPRDQADMDDLLRLYADAILKHRVALFDEPEVTIASMEREFASRDFANQPFNPTGRFC